MSIICSVLGVSPEQIGALRANPPLASYLAMHTGLPQLGGSRAPEVLAALGSFAEVLDLHKSWHLLHYLFTGEVGPAASPGGTLMSGEELGEDVGYGPPRLHDAEATSAFAAFLKQLTPEKLATRLNLQEMQRAGVYAIPMPSRAVEKELNELRKEIRTYFEPLRDYVVNMAARNNGLLIWLS